MEGEARLKSILPRVALLAVALSSGALLEHKLHIAGKIFAVLSLMEAGPSDLSDESEIKQKQKQECSTPELEINLPEDKNVLSREEADELLKDALQGQSIKESGQWSKWILEAMHKEEFAFTTSKMAALLAIIEQESAFQGDPKTSGIRGKLDAEEQKIRDSYPLLIPLLEGTALRPFFEKYKDKASRVETEGDAVHVLQDAISDLKGNYPSIVTELAYEDPDWELKALQAVGTLGPTQVSVLFTFTEAERRSLTPEQYAQRQREMIENPEIGILYTVRRFKAGAQVNGKNFLQTVGDYKGGQDAHFKAKIQLALRLLNPDLVVDGDLLRYDHRGLPLDEDSKTLTTALAFNEQFQLGFSREEIFSSFAKNGPELVQDCVIRSFLDRATREEDFELGMVTLDTKKGGTDRKGQETVSQYVKKVGDRYSRWRKILEELRMARQLVNAPAQPVPAQPSRKEKGVESSPLPNKTKPAPVVVEKTPSTPQKIPVQKESEPFEDRRERRAEFVRAVRGALARYPGCDELFQTDIQLFDTHTLPAVMLQFSAPSGSMTFAIQEDGEDGSVYVKQYRNAPGQERVVLTDGHVASMEVIRTKVVTWIETTCAQK